AGVLRAMDDRQSERVLYMLARHATATLVRYTALSRSEVTTVTVTVLDEYDSPVSGVAAALAGSVTGSNTATLTFAAGTTAGTYTSDNTTTVPQTLHAAVSRLVPAIRSSPTNGAISSAA